MPRRIARLAVLIAVILAGFRAAPVAAAPARQAPSRFVFIVPSGFETEFISFWNTYQGDLNAAYDFYQVLYGVEPPLPVYIQVYAQRADLFTENILVTPLPDKGTHTHLGAREIALVAPWPNGYLVSARGLQAVKHELNNVFLSVLAANNLTAGLEIGLSQYVTASDADREAAVAKVAAAQQAGTLYSWRALLDNPVIYSEAQVGHPQAFAVVAFLADRYGFPSLVQLVAAFGKGQTLDDALQTVYGQPLDRLEDAWQDYLPGFLEARWQYNALYAFDLAPFEAALDAGAYTQVARGLGAALPFLEQSGQAAQLTQAQALLERAQAGVAAGDLVLQTRAALQAGLFDKTLELAAQARAAYADLGNTTRDEEIAGYAARATHVLDLRAQLANAVARYEAGQVASAEPDLLALIPQLETVGDVTQAAQAEALIQQLYARRQVAAAERLRLAQRSLQIFVIALGGWLVAQVGALVYRRWRKPAPGVL